MPLGLPHKLTPGARGFASGPPDAPGAVAATTTNIANALTPVCHWFVQQGETLILLRPDRFPARGEYGASAFRPRLKLRDNAGVELAPDSRLVFAVRGPADIQPVPLVELEYAAWQGLTYAEQGNAENVDSLSVDFPTPDDADAMSLEAGTALVLLVRAALSVSLAVASGTRIELPVRRDTGAVVL